MKKRLGIVFILILCFAVAVCAVGCTDGNTEPIPQTTPPAENDPVDENQNRQEPAKPAYSRETVGGIDYIIFGKAPQTAVSASHNTVMLNLLATGQLAPKSAETPHIYAYGGEDYELVTGTAENAGRKLSNGVEILEGGKYFIKYEALRWIVAEETATAARLLCTTAVCAEKYNSGSFNRTSGYLNGTDTAANDFAASDINTALNNSFLSSAFTAAERDLIADTQLGDKNYKLFIPALGEVKTAVCGYNADLDLMTAVVASDYIRAGKLPTDALHASAQVENSYFIGWWLRGAEGTKIHSCYVSAVGQVGGSRYANVDATFAVIPALTLKL